MTRARVTHHPDGGWCVWLETRTRRGLLTGLYYLDRRPTWRQALDLAWDALRDAELLRLP